MRKKTKLITGTLLEADIIEKSKPFNYKSITKGLPDGLHRIVLDASKNYELVWDIEIYSEKNERGKTVKKLNKKESYIVSKSDGTRGEAGSVAVLSRNMEKLRQTGY